MQETILTEKHQYSIFRLFVLLAYMNIKFVSWVATVEAYAAHGAIIMNRTERKPFCCSRICDYRRLDNKHRGEMSGIRLASYKTYLQYRPETNYQKSKSKLSSKSRPCLQQIKLNLSRIQMLICHSGIG